ncbi:MAG: response regulator [Candidatus Methanomethylicaceae archaeon]
MKEKKRVLIVDDDEDINKSMSELLRKAGFLVDVAFTGKEALKKARECIYHIALIDIKLPDISGIELLTQLEERVPRTRKIIITGYASLDNAVKALNLGADAYLMKPVDPEDLLNIVKKQSEKQDSELIMTQEKVVKFIETRVKTLEEEHENNNKETKNEAKNIKGR